MASETTLFFVFIVGNVANNEAFLKSYYLKQ